MMGKPRADQSRDTVGRRPIPDESRKRIQQALRKTLEKELANAQQNLNVGGARPVFYGPWSMLTGECDGWLVRTRLSRELYARMRGHFNDNLLREVLLAAAGLKVTRTSLSDAKLTLLSAIASHHGFCLLASTERYVHCRDTGKGGCCNAIERVARPDEDTGLRIVYIASEPSLAEAAKLLEEAGDDQLFGMLLGIPSCCREAYVRFAPLAIAKQFDLVPMVLDNTPGEMPYDPWLNYPAIYFGRALLSFFPCSFRCPAAGVAARRTFEMLAECDAAWADSFLDLQGTNILYTEYQGVFLFRGPLVDGSIRYKPGDVDSTEPTEVAALIRSGDRLTVRGKHQVDIYRGMKRIAALEGDDVGMCAFR